MKLSSLRHVKRVVLLSLLLSFLCITALEMILPVFHPSVLASPDTTTVAVDPATSSANPGQYFTINVTITNVTALIAWGFRVKFPRGILEIDKENITEGPFLKQGGTTLFTANVIEDYIDVGNYLLGTGVSGSGTLASATFKVLMNGNATLDLYKVSLLNSSGAIDDWDNKDSSNDGYFYTTGPVAKYTYTPHPTDYPGHPIVNEIITFNATASYDPDQSYRNQTGSGIVNYSWDFGDNSTGTGSVINHTFSDPGSYKVTLNITDDDGESYSIDHPIIGTTITVQLHDIAVTNVTVTPTEVSIGDSFTINITVSNEGSDTETLNVTAYANMQPVETKLFTWIFTDPWGGETEKTSLEPGKNATTTMTWDTTGLSAGSYTISVKAFLVKMNQSKWQSMPDLEREEDMYDNGMFYGNVNITTAERHDLAITSLKVSPTNLKVGEWSSIKVIIKNEGTKSEWFNATTTIEYGLEPPRLKSWSNQTIDAGTTVTLEHLWLEGTNETKEGEYNITVTVVLVNKTTLDFLQPYNATIPDDDPTENTRRASETIRLFPVAYFTYSPSEPLVDQIVTFDASASYLPGTPQGTIVRYTWDFGDGTGITETDSITSHVFRLNRTYTIALTVTDDDARVGNVSRDIEVNPFQNIAITNVTSSPHIATSGDPISIDVTVNTRFFKESFNVTTYFNGNMIGTRSNITLPVGNSTTLTFTWDTAGVLGGNYTIKAVASTRTENTTFFGGIVTIKRVPSTVTLTTSSTSLTVGATTTLSGTVSTQSEVNVTILYRLDNEETWKTLETVTTNADGTYSHSWTPETAGTYTIKSSWEGNDITMPNESEIIAVTVQEVSPPSPFLYTTVGIAIVLIIALFYFVRVRKPGPK